MCGQCDATCGASEHLQHTWDITEDRVGEVRDKEERIARSAGQPVFSIVHTPWQPSWSWLGFKQCSRVEGPRCMHGLARRWFSDCEGVVEMGLTGEIYSPKKHNGETP